MRLAFLTTFKACVRKHPTYTLAVFKRPKHPLLRLMSVRLAAFMVLLAVASALFGPVAQLAQDVQMGRLGGVCNASKAFAAAGQTGDAASEHAHCELCGSLAIALPPIVMASIPTYAGHPLALAEPPSELARFGLGLPNSRGPPSLLI